MTTKTIDDHGDIENSPPPPPVSSKEDAGGDDDAEEEEEVTVPILGAYLFGYFLASMIFLIAVTVLDEDQVKWYGYGVAAGALGMIVSFVALLLVLYKPDMNQSYIAIFLALWGAIAAFLFTFSNASPFKFTGNGYFALWAMVFFGASMVGISMDSVLQRTANLGSYGGLMVCSVIMIIAAAFVIGGEEGYFGYDDFKDNTILIICVACLTLPLLVGNIYMRQKLGDSNSSPTKLCMGSQLLVMAIFCICWIISAGLCTFQGPFAYTGNGYFGSWFGAILSVAVTADFYQQYKMSSSE